MLWDILHYTQAVTLFQVLNKSNNNKSSRTTGGSAEPFNVTLFLSSFLLHLLCCFPSLLALSLCGDVGVLGVHLCLRCFCAALNTESMCVRAAPAGFTRKY